MDASVLAAVAKWPNVPDVYGWLRLTARGEWRLRGEPIANQAVREFIGRNYAHDDRGCWYFQNGPQRVYVELDLAPWVLRVQADGGLRTHTGLVPRELRAAALVDDRHVVLVTELGAGNVDDRDAAQVVGALTDGEGQRLSEAALERWVAGEGDARLDAAALGLRGGAVAVERIGMAMLGSRFGFEPQPAAS